MIESGELVVLFLDESHLLWGDVMGYIWGKTDQRIEVPVVNERQRQTYFGALNYRTREFLVQAYPKGNSEFTIEFLKYLKAQYPQQRLALFWDGASASIAALNSKRTCNRSMVSQPQIPGKSPALDLLPMRS